MVRRAPTLTFGDFALGLGTIVFVASVTMNIEAGDGERTLDLLGYATIVASGGALTWRRMHPRAVLAVIVVALLVYTERAYHGGPIYLTLGVALYTLADMAGDRREALLTAGAVVAVMTVGGILVSTEEELTWHLFVFPGWAAAAVFLGDAHRNRRDYLAGLEERARRLEESREEEARRRVAEERLRIARDLHDVVAHSIATITLQAGVAAHVLDRRPEEAADALRAIKLTSREALQELRATLDILRSEDDDTAPRAPTPGLDRVEALAESAAQAGLPVEVRRVGSAHAATVPAAVDVAAFRIVQESLTNVMRHAGATRATVTLTTSDEAVEVEVTDDGRGASTSGDADGHGIAGMRERASLAGGDLQAGPRPGGGFRVWARLPLRAVTDGATV